MSSFQSHYRKVVEYAKTKAINPEEISADDPAVALFCSYQLPQDQLLKIEDNLDFVNNAYYKILSRAPRSREGARRAASIQSKRDRIRIINDLMNSDEYAEKGVRVRFVK